MSTVREWDQPDGGGSRHPSISTRPQKTAIFKYKYVWIYYKVGHRTGKNLAVVIFIHLLANCPQGCLRNSTNAYKYYQSSLSEILLQARKFDTFADWHQKNCNLHYYPQTQCVHQDQNPEVLALVSIISSPKQTSLFFAPSFYRP